MSHEPTIENNNNDYNKLLSYVQSGENIFLTGPGGVGKSYYINKLKKELKDINLYLTSTTGVSAFNLGAQTIHSFSGIGVLNKGDTVEKIIKKIRRSKNYEAIVSKIIGCQLLVIDEISMLGKCYLEMINQVFQVMRKTKKIFGGIQVIFTGDFLQLPPIDDKFCFHSPIWNSLTLKTIYLTKMYRVTDPNYTDLLTRVRIGKHAENDNKVLYQRFFAYKKWEKENDVDEKEQEPGILKFKNDEITPTFLFGKRMNVNEKNMEELHKNPNEPIFFMPRFVAGKYGVDYEKNLNMEPLQLKIGAQVMLNVNLSVDEGLVNGSRGVITDYKDGLLYVKFMNGITIGFDRHEYTFTEDDEKVLYKIVQYPFILAYALSIHKVQGCTLDYAIIDLGFSVFEASMSYVALSRVRNLDGLLLKSYQPQRIFCHQDALAFYENLE